MTTNQLNKLFETKILEKGIHKILEVDKNQISNYRRRRDELSLGLKLELLLKMKAISIVDESKRTT